MSAFWGFISMIDALIDKQDSFEIIRDQIAGILVSESTSQQTLAVSLGKDPNQWKLDVYLERSNPWEKFLNPDFLKSDELDSIPIVNVWYDNGNFDMSSSNISERQKSVGTFNIDCYGFGFTKDDPSSGHIPGDRTAALEAQRTIRLCRNILMAATYTYLDLRGLVWRRWVQSINVFQPELDGRAAQKIVGARMAFQVEYNEFSPQVTPVELELVSIVVDDNTGRVLIEADYDYT